jgi:eukaryotic-like serine/threonine-protein kinase
VHTGIVCLSVSLLALAARAEQPAEWTDNIRQGRTLQSEGRFEEAERRFQAALHLAERLPGEADLEAITLSDLASVKMDLGQLQEAARLCERAISVLARSAGKSDARVQAMRSELAALYLEAGQAGTAEKLLRNVVVAQPGGTPAASTEAAFALDVMACLYARKKKPAAAEAAERRSLAVLEALPHPDNASLAVGNVHLSIFLNSRNRAAEALPYAERGLTLLQAIPKHQEILEAGALMSLASIHAGLGRPDEAEQESQHALETTERFYGPHHVQTAWVLLAHAAVLRRLDRKDAARQFQKRGEGILKEKANSRLGQTVPLEALLPREK